MCLSATFLEAGKRRIEKEQSCYDSSFVILMQDGLKHNGRFKQPWYKRAEFIQCIAQRMCRCIRYCVRTVFFKMCARFFVHEASWTRFVSQFYDRPV